MRTGRPTQLQVFSVDAMQSDDLTVSCALPSFARILERASLAEIESIFPTNIYPWHAAQITGRPPAMSCVYNNEQFQPRQGTRPEWLWDSRALRVPTSFTTIFDLDGPFESIQETIPGAAVGTSWDGQPFVWHANLDFPIGRGSHGYLPTNCRQPLFIASGPSSMPGVDLGRRSMLAEVRTFAAVVDVNMPDATERDMTDLLAGA